MYFPWAGEGRLSYPPLQLLTVLKPLYSLAIPEVNSSRFEINFIVEMRYESPGRADVTVKMLAGMPLNRVSFLNELKKRKKKKQKNRLTNWQ